MGYGSEIIFPNVAYDEYFEIEIDRSKIMDQLLEIYSSAGDTIIGQTLKVRFLKEEGDDFGGLTKELFSLFWQVRKYFIKCCNTLLMFQYIEKRICLIFKT